VTEAELQLLARQEFPIADQLIHLNHAAVGPWPLSARDAAISFANENMRLGSTHYPQWLKKENHLRKQLADLIKAKSPGEIALSKNTSEALSTVAYGLTWQPGDEVIISDQEFPSNRIVWESLQSRFGVKVITAPLYSQPTPELAILNCLTPRTRLVSISSIQYGTGLKLDLNILGNELKNTNTLFCVDAIQSVGASQIDVNEDCIDFLMADGHKWMLGPEGLALFYVRKQRQNQLNLNQFGWHMVKDRGNYDRQDWEPADNATRFECGSPNMLAAHILSASLEVLQQVGIENVATLIQQNVLYLAEALADIPSMNIITDLTPGRFNGILTFKVDGKDSSELYKQLNLKDVLCACRGGGVRFSPHFYTPRTALDSAL